MRSSGPRPAFTASTSRRLASIAKLLSTARREASSAVRPSPASISARRRSNSDWVSLVGASYGLSDRTLGAVSLLGPVRMDYDKALRSVRAAAHELSRFLEEIYEDN